MRGVSIPINEDFDLQVNAARGADGKLLGFELAETIHQNKALILAHQPGQFKDEPTLGVGLDNSLLDHNLPSWKRIIRLALEQDGQSVRDIAFTPTGLKIDAKYNR